MFDLDAHIRFEAQEEMKSLRRAKDKAYSERNKVVAALAVLLSRNIFRNTSVGVAQHDINDKDWEADWRTILVIELPTGQVTWHFHDSEKHLLEGLPEVKDYKWDGHSAEEKYKRLLDFLLI
jgi:hypothetical protein